jgi:hypothetical protein
VCVCACVNVCVLECVCLCLYCVCIVCVYCVCIVCVLCVYAGNTRGGRGGVIITEGLLIQIWPLMGGVTQASTLLFPRK